MKSRLLLASLLALLACAPAQAGFFTASAVDGAVSSLGDVDLARDGTGGVVYVKSDGGVPHVFLSRHVDGAWRAPERVDFGLETASSQPVIAAADGHRIAIAWVSGGRLYGTVVGGPGPGPLPGPTLIHADQDPLKAVRDPHMDMGINGTAYVVFTAPGPGGTDVRAARLQEATWESLASPLDIAGDQPAGDEKSKPRVAVSAEGNAVAVWGEGHADGRRRVYGRRLTGTALSLAPQEISVGEFEGKPGGNADSPDLEIEDDGSYAWVVFRQDVGGASRVIARRLVGSLFEAPAPIEATGFGVNPRIGMTGRGAGFAVAGIEGANAVGGALLYADVFEAPVSVQWPASDRAPMPVVAASEKDHVVVAWRGPNGSVHAKHKPAKLAFEPVAVLSDPAGGVAADEGGMEITEDRQGNFAVAFLQGPVTDRKLMIGEYDRIPGVPTPTSTTNNQNRSRPTFRWHSGLELWGPVTFRVVVDGESLGTTTTTSLRSPKALDDGPHRWRVIAVDRRGQETPSRERVMRIDKTLPEVRLSLKGTKKAGAGLRYKVTVDDFGGSGIKYATIVFGDGSPETFTLQGIHRWRKAGRYNVRLKAVDRAGNVRRSVVRLRIKK